MKCNQSNIWIKKEQKKNQESKNMWNEIVKFKMEIVCSFDGSIKKTQILREHTRNFL